MLPAITLGSLSGNDFDCDECPTGSDFLFLCFRTPQKLTLLTSNYIPTGIIAIVNAIKDMGALHSLDLSDNNV
jgi:hypothetical protein